MSVLAAIRPDDWNFPLLLHVLGAMLLVGGLFSAVVALMLGWGRDARHYARFAFWSLLAVAFPSWWLMRIAGEWIASKEDFAEGEEPSWLGVGYITAELGGLLLLISIVLSGIGMRRLRRAEGGEPTSVLIKISGVLVSVVLLAYIIAVWAMTAKPD